MSNRKKTRPQARQKQKLSRVPSRHRPYSGGVLYHPETRHDLDNAAALVGMKRLHATPPWAERVTFSGAPTTTGGTLTVEACGRQFSFSYRKGTSAKTIARKIRDGINATFWREAGDAVR